MESFPENTHNSIFWPMIFLLSLSALLEASFILFLMGISFFSSSFYLFLIEGTVLYTFSYLLVFRKLIAGTGKPEIPAIILIIFCFFTLVFFILGIILIAGIVLGGWRDKKAYYENHPKPSAYHELSQIIVEGWPRAFRRYRITKEAHLAAACFILFLYGIALMIELGFFAAFIQHFFHSFNKGFNADIFSLLVSFVALPLSLVRLVYPVSKLYMFLPGRTGVITKLKVKKGLCIVKVQGLNFRASNPEKLEVGTEVSIRKVTVRNRTESAILDIEAENMGYGNNLAWAMT